MARILSDPPDTLIDVAGRRGRLPCSLYTAAWQYPSSHCYHGGGGIGWTTLSAVILHAQGSCLSERVVTGVVTNLEISDIPFSKANNFPIRGGFPLVNGNNINCLNNVNGLVNNKNLPFLTGINQEQVNTIIQNIGTNNMVSRGNNQPWSQQGRSPQEPRSRTSCLGP
ncbi:hypothetical protein MLD38_024172 [Melastoma candidum]|uniref:Uncharacterized protein n=1 Tax=Melastoma candidum TaxID=119954 RepID=A0ACB9NR86_9MYRT|nr:hypothetical protein MLD38_024172 [Melastoma candidum]